MSTEAANSRVHNDGSIRVMLVDDHDMVRKGFRMLLSQQHGIDVVADVNSGESAIAHCRNKDIDVILMDVNMPGIGGMETTRRIKQQWPHIGVIIITVHADGPLPRKLLEAGAMGYLTKGNEVSEMVEAIFEVHRGGRYIARDIAQQLAMQMLPGQKENIIDDLSRRELQILMMIAQGHKNNEIADALSLSPKTVSTYRFRLHQKLDVSSDVDMVKLAMKHGILDESDSSNT